MSIDLTFGSFDAGTLGALYAEFCVRRAEVGESEEDNALEEFRDILEDHAQLQVVIPGDDSRGEPMSSSRNVWFWHKDPVAIEARLRRQLLE